MHTQHPLRERHTHSPRMGVHTHTACLGGDRLLVSPGEDVKASRKWAVWTALPLLPPEHCLQMLSCSLSRSFICWRTMPGMTVNTGFPLPCGRGLVRGVSFPQQGAQAEVTCGQPPGRLSCPSRGSFLLWAQHRFPQRPACHARETEFQRLPFLQMPGHEAGHGVPGPESPCPEAQDATPL